MKISSAAISLLAFTLTTANAQSFVYKFDPHRAGGIDGSIIVQYDSPDSTRATISAALDFAHIDKDAIVKADGNCTGVDIVQYKWHIHVKWSSNYTSESFQQCGKPLTGNHYDPLKACGPFSEFVDTQECKDKVAKMPYSCTPDKYAADPLVCEKGDLSGKVGDFKPAENGKMHARWVDEHYPAVGENTPEWNIIIHAVCGKATPRVACALGQKVVKLAEGGEGSYGGGYGGEPQWPSPTPSRTSTGSYGGHDGWHKPTPCPTGTNGGHQGIWPTWTPSPTGDDSGNGKVNGY